jgi:hypothetical protein
MPADPPQKKRPKKVHVEPVTNVEQWDAITAYIEWYDSLPNSLQPETAHRDKIQKLRNG